MQSRADWELRNSRLMSYMNVEEIESALARLAEVYPNETELIELPNPSHENRTTHCLRVYAGTGSSPDSILMLGGVHAREWIPPDAVVSLAADLLEAYQRGTGLRYGQVLFRAEKLKHLMESCGFFFFACVNPDGRFFSQTQDPDWRKTGVPPATIASAWGSI